MLPMEAHLNLNAGRSRAAVASGEGAAPDPGARRPIFASRASRRVHSQISPVYNLGSFYRKPFERASSPDKNK
jgi:hypothetical protein